MATTLTRTTQLFSNITLNNALGCKQFMDGVETKSRVLYVTTMNVPAESGLLVLGVSHGMSNTILQISKTLQKNGDFEYNIKHTTLTIETNSYDSVCGDSYTTAAINLILGDKAVTHPTSHHTKQANLKMIYELVYTTHIGNTIGGFMVYVLHNSNNDVKKSELVKVRFSCVVETRVDSKTVAETHTDLSTMLQAVKQYALLETTGSIRINGTKFEVDIEPTTKKTQDYYYCSLTQETLNKLQEALLVEKFNGVYHYNDFVSCGFSYADAIHIERMINSKDFKAEVLTKQYVQLSINRR